jgi:hypothetical protein
MVRYVVAALGLAGALVTNALPVRASGADPYQIFGHARNVWAQQRYPAYLTYTVTVNVTERGVDKTKHYHLAYDAQNAKIYVNPVSDEERAAPPDPNGVTFHLLPKRQHQVLFDKKVGNPGEAVDYLGVPMVSPTYSFGMSTAAFEGDRDPDALVQEIRREYADPTPPLKARQIANSGPIKTIAMVTGYHRNYDITLAGMDNLDGHQCYHLLLKPTYQSARLRLRELWVDTQTFETLKLVTAANFTGSQVPWTITFADMNGALYIAQEEAMKPVGVGDHRYEHASVSFDAITPSDRPPTNLSSWFVTKENIMAEPDPDAPGAPR